MGFFNSKETVDGKARTVLGDLPGDPSPYEILRTVDQKAGDTVDPDDVVAKLRDLDDDVDEKLAAVENDDVDQKDMRAAADAIADRTPLSYPGAMELVSAVVDSVDQMDPAVFVDAFDSATASEHVDETGLDQNAQTDDSSSDMTPDADTSDSTGSDAPDDGGVDQKQDDGSGDGSDAMNPIDLVEEIGGSDARDTVEDYAESVNKDVEDAAAEWVAENVPGVTVEGYGDGGGDDAAPPASGDPATGPDQNAGGHDRTAPGADQKAGGQPADQKLEDVNLNERVAAAVTSDEVLDDMAGAVAQKLASDDTLADQLVETVDQKGDFATTDQTVATAPSTESETVDEAAPLTGGDDE